MNPELRFAEAMWHSFDNGASLGQQGSEQGIIVQDEEHRDGARITLERDGGAAPFSITCGIYGLFVHTAFASDEPEALQMYSAMKERLDLIIRSEQREISVPLEAFCDEF